MVFKNLFFFFCALDESSVSIGRVKRDTLLSIAGSTSQASTVMMRWVLRAGCLTIGVLISTSGYKAFLLGFGNYPHLSTDGHKCLLLSCPGYDSLWAFIMRECCSVVLSIGIWHCVGVCGNVFWYDWYSLKVCSYILEDQTHGMETSRSTWTC